MGLVASSMVGFVSLTACASTPTIELTSANIQTIYQTVQSSLVQLKQNHQESQLTVSSLNQPDGYLSTLQTKLSNALNLDINQVIQSMVFNVNRYLDTITLSLDFQPNSLPANLQLNNVKPGSQANSLIMSFQQLGIANYVSNDDLANFGSGVNEFINQLVKQSLANINLDTLNSTSNVNQFFQVLQAKGFNTNLIATDSSMFQIGINENRVGYYATISNQAVFDPNCHSQDNWSFDSQYHNLAATWINPPGALEQLLSRGRLMVINNQIQQAITKLITTFTGTLAQLQTKLNSSSFSNQIWTTMATNTGFKFKNPSDQPTFSFSLTKTSQPSSQANQSPTPGFNYTYSFKLPNSIILSSDITNKQFKISNTSNQGHLIILVNPIFIPANLSN